MFFVTFSDYYFYDVIVNRELFIGEVFSYQNNSRSYTKKFLNSKCLIIEVVSCVVLLYLYAIPVYVAIKCRIY